MDYTITGNADIDARNKQRAQLANTGANLSANTPITPQSLQPVTPIVVPSVTPDTTASGIIGSANPNALTSADQARANIDAMSGGVNAVAKERTDAVSRGEDIYNKISSIQENQANSPEELQINEERKTLAGINTEIANEQVALRAEQDAIRNKGFITQDAQNTLLGNAEDKYGRRLADLAIRQAASQGNIDSFTKASDRALELKLAPLKTQLAYLTDFKLKNLDSLSADEKDKLNKVISEKKNIEDKVTADHKVFSDYMLEASKNSVKVPDGAIAEALKDPANTPAIFAKYGVSLQDPLDKAYKLAQTDNLNADTRKKLGDLSDSSGGYITTATVINPDGTKTSVAVPTTKGLQAQAQTKANVDLISSVANTRFLANAVGPNWLSRVNAKNFVTGEKSNFIASVKQLTDQLTLDSLVRAKANGATFGALSEGELNVLANSASKLNSWAVKDGNGNVTGYNANQKDFKEELDKINNFAKLDYLIKGGEPADIGALKLPDGTVWTKNSDGTLTQIK